MTYDKITGAAGGDDRQPPKEGATVQSGLAQGPAFAAARGG
jgi:hypothetical protein